MTTLKQEQDGRKMTEYETSAREAWDELQSIEWDDEKEKRAYTESPPEDYYENLTEGS